VGAGQQSAEKRVKPSEEKSNNNAAISERRDDASCIQYPIKDVYFYSTMPVSNCDDFEHVPFLKMEDAKIIAQTGFFSFIAVFLAFLAVVNSGSGQTVQYLDPWTKDFLLGKDTIFPLVSLFLLGVTSFVFLKQWGYYYLIEGGGKQGIIARKIKTVNHLEKTMDMLLAIYGALLFPMSVFPLQWLFFFMLYAFLVAFRSGVTLMRKTFSQWLANNSSPTERFRAWLRKRIGLKAQRKQGFVTKEWYYKSLEFNYRKDELKKLMEKGDLSKRDFEKIKEKFGIRFVLTGWIISDLILGTISGITGFALYVTYPWNGIPIIRVLIYFSVLSVILLLHYGLRTIIQPIVRLAVKKPR
jgi:hypothetical protein